MGKGSLVSSVFRSGLFKDKVAIVTGGATGIGNAITNELLHLGCNVVIASRKMERLEAAEKELNSRYGSESRQPAYAVQCNIRKEAEVKNLMEKTVEKFGKIDYLVNNGGGQFPSPAADVSLKGWNAVVETNLTGTFLMCREAYDSWMNEHGGSIVNIISDMFRGFPIMAHWMRDHGGSIVTIITDMWKGWPNMAHSGAARAGVDNLTKSLSIEWAEKGIRINAVAPGSSIFSDTAAANYADPELFHRTIPGIPARRLGKPEEVSAAVLFLLSPASAFTTGVTMKVDGGASLYSQSFWTVPDHDRMPAFTWDGDSSDRKKSKI